MISSSFGSIGSNPIGVVSLFATFFFSCRCMSLHVQRRNQRQWYIHTYLPRCLNTSCWGMCENLISIYLTHAITNLLVDNLEIEGKAGWRTWLNHPYLLEYLYVQRYNCNSLVSVLDIARVAGIFRAHHCSTSTQPTHLYPSPSFLTCVAWHV